MLGFFFGRLYSYSAPHLHQGNIHHYPGWILFALIITQVVGGFLNKIFNAIKGYVAESDRFQTIGPINQSSYSAGFARSDSSSIVSDLILHDNNDNMLFLKKMNL